MIASQRWVCIVGRCDFGLCVRYVWRVGLGEHVPVGLIARAQHTQHGFLVVHVEQCELYHAVAVHYVC